MVSASFRSYTYCSEKRLPSSDGVEHLAHVAENVVGGSLGGNLQGVVVYQIKIIGVTGMCHKNIAKGVKAPLFDLFYISGLT